MDDVAEIGSANHLSYEKNRKVSAEEEIPFRRENASILMKLTNVECGFGLDLAKLDVNMFGAVNNSLINDGCGLFRGRMILPYEHLSRFQNDIID